MPLDRSQAPPSIGDYVGREPTVGRLSGGRQASRAATTVRPGVATVVTVTFNSAATLDRTIDSIAAQDYPKVEYIVVDGGSRDGTLDRLRARSGDIDLWISEPDRGISDAFNKGIALASGEFVALVNSDDWLEPVHLSKAIAALQESGADFVFGDLMLHAPDGAPAYVLVGESDYSARLPHTMPQINHPTVLCRRKVYETHGLFDTRLFTAMDFEWLLRGHQNGVRGRYVPGLMGHMSMDGTSDRHFSRGLKEVSDVSIRYGYPAYSARVRYAIRCAKTASRRAFQSWVPKRLYEWLRHKLNSQYKSIGAPSP